MTTEEKIKTLIAGVCEQFPGTRPVDIQKRTPKGAQIREAIVRCARKIAVETGDKEFLTIARTFQSQMSTKPAPGFDTK